MPLSRENRQTRTHTDIVVYRINQSRCWLIEKFDYIILLRNSFKPLFNFLNKIINIINIVCRKVGVGVGFLEPKNCTKDKDIYIAYSFPHHIHQTTICFQ